MRTFKNGTNVINKLLPDFWSVCSAADIAVCYEPVCKFLLRLNCRSVHQFVGINDNQMCTNCLLKPDELALRYDRFLSKSIIFINITLDYVDYIQRINYRVVRE